MGLSRSSFLAICKDNTAVISGPPVSTLKKRADFLRLRRSPKFSGKFFTIRAGACSGEHPRIGYTVTTKVGNSVERSRIKRRLRETARQVANSRSLPLLDYVVLARRSVLTAEFEMLKQDFMRALDQLQQNGAKGSRHHA